MHHLAELEDSLEPPAMGHIEIPLVRDQIRRGNIVKAARIFKQGVCMCVCVFVHCVYIFCFVKGFPEFMSFPRFRRRYESLVPVNDRPVGIIDEKKVSCICGLLNTRKEFVTISDAWYSDTVVIF